jgi:PAS domain S-box-containing protein
MDYSTRSKEELIEELKALKLEYFELKSSCNKIMSATNLAEEKLLKRTNLMSSLSKYSIELAETEYNKIQEFIVFRFKSLFDVRGVWISSYNETHSELTIEASTATKNENSRILKYLGGALSKHKTIINEEKYREMVETGVKVFSSLHDISFGQIPEVVSQDIERIFNVGWFQGVALVDNGKLFGTLVIAGFRGQEELDLDIVRIFAELTSNVLRRKQAEINLLASEEKFRKIFITSPHSININRLHDGSYVSINNGFSKLTGYSEEEVIGKTSFELNLWANPSDRDILIKGLKEKGEIDNLETQFRTKNGSVKDGIISATIIELAGEEHILSITRDITERKESEERIHKSEGKYRLLAENISDVIWKMDTETMHFTYVSPSVERLRGYTADEIIALPMTHALTEDAFNYITNQTKKQVQDILDGIEKPGKYYTDEVQQPCKDGSLIWTEVITSFNINPENGKVEVLGVTRDITERKKAEEALRQSEINAEIAQRKKVEAEVNKVNAGLEKRVAERTAQLEAANSELQAFAYSVSHDLRAPLRAIDGFSKYVLEDYSSKLDAEGQRLLGLIRSNTQKMDKLITDILSLSRVTRSEHKKSNIDMTKMALSMYSEAVSNDIKDTLNFSIENLPEIFADPTYIKQVWINLISNAVKFSAFKELPLIKIGGYVENGYHVYWIKDNGVGFNQEYAHKLFGVFQRLHRSDEFEGTGVGLAIVQRIIHRHGGKVWAEGKENDGATFYFSLPSESLLIDSDK